MHGYKTIPLAIVILLGSTAHPMASEATAALEPLRMETRYEGSFSGLPLGRVRVTFIEQPTSYRLQLDTKSRGVASLFSDMKSVAEVRGDIDAKRRYIHRLYRSTEDKNGKANGLNQYIAYNKKGAITKQLREPRDDINWRPLVPIADANTATDPISAFFILRKALARMLAKNQSQTEVRTYDGARLATMQLTLIGRTPIDMMDAPMNVVETRIERSPIAGYTPKEWKKFHAGDPEIHIYFSDDARLMPVLFTISLTLGELRIELDEATPLPAK